MRTTFVRHSTSTRPRMRVIPHSPSARSASSTLSCFATGSSAPSCRAPPSAPIGRGAAPRPDRHAPPAGRRYPRVPWLGLGRRGAILRQGALDLAELDDSDDLMGGQYGGQHLEHAPALIHEKASFS